MRLALYARVSTRDKGQDTTNQLREMRLWAEINRHDVVAEYIDQASGSGKQKRPNFEAMLCDAALGQWDCLVFWSLDRLSREGVFETLRYLRRLDDAGVAWRSHTEAYLDSCGIFREAVLAILAAIAKQERVRISERVTAGLQTARERGARGERSKTGKRLAGRSGRPRARVDEALLARVREAADNGSSRREIARKWGLSVTGVQRLLKGGQQ